MATGQGAALSGAGTPLLLARAQPLDALDDRTRTIFKLIVESYLSTGEPVGSRNLARGLPMVLSPASVRNVMSDLEEHGLVYSPHVSAGRLPTQIGLRFFVGGFSQQWGYFAAGSIIVSIPVVFLFLYLQKYLVGGLTAGSVKG